MARINNSDGTKGTRTFNLFGDSLAYEDIQFSFTTARVPQSNAPTWSALTTNLYKFTFDIGDYVDLEGNEVIHARQAESSFYPHLHIYTNGSELVNKYVKFQVFYSICNVNAVETEDDFDKEFTIPAETPDKTHLMFEFDEISGVGINFGAEISVRFKRIAADGAAPVADPFVSQFGIHIVVDSIGSNTISEK